MNDLRALIRRQLELEDEQGGMGVFGQMVDWRRVATRNDRCPTVFFSALAQTATVLFWL